MHKYLNAIGFHDIASEREWYQILLESEKKFSDMTVLPWTSTQISVSFAGNTATGLAFLPAALSMKMMKSSAENAISHIFQAVESALMLILQ